MDLLSEYFKRKINLDGLTEYRKFVGISKDIERVVTNKDLLYTIYFLTDRPLLSIIFSSSFVSKTFEVSGYKEGRVNWLLYEGLGSTTTLLLVFVCSKFEIIFSSFVESRDEETEKIEERVSALRNIFCEFLKILFPPPPLAFTVEIEERGEEKG